jgi:hypothetical protein
MRLHRQGQLFGEHLVYFDGNDLRPWFEESECQTPQTWTYFENFRSRRNARQPNNALNRIWIDDEVLAKLLGRPYPQLLG